MPLDYLHIHIDGQPVKFRPTDTLRMHGPAFDGSGRSVNRDVTAQDVKAYEAAGYRLGSIVEEVEIVAEAEPEAPKPVKTKSKK